MKLPHLLDPAALLARKALTRSAILFAALLLTVVSAKTFAQSKVIGNPDAPVGGTFNAVLDSEPELLHPLKTYDGYAVEIFAYVIDSLLIRNPETYELQPGLAEKWEESKDGKQITFTLRQGAKFHDGSPVTVEDVKFSFDAIFDDKLSDPVFRSFYENFEKAEILGPQQIRFHIKKKYFLNLGSISEMYVLPKAHYGDPNKKMNKTIVASGPYKLEKYDQGKILILKRNPDWWGHSLPQYKGYNKFEAVTLRFMFNFDARFELFKKGDLDKLRLLPEQYYKKTDGPEWGKTLIKVKADNDAQKRTAFMGFNLKKPLFQDVRVRKAISYLLNRPFMIEKFLFGDGLASSGPWYPQNMYADPKAKPLPFDPKAAAKLLKEAGWADSDKDGVLDKVIGGTKTSLRFTVINGGSVWDKFLTVYKEDLKKAGIDLVLKVVEWNALQKAIDDRDYEAVAMSFGGTIESDPKQVWHSASDVKGGSNFFGYKNAEVDSLIDKAREEFNRKKRVEILKKVYNLIGNDYPAVFFWSPKSEYYAHSSRVSKVVPTYKYDLGYGTWWVAAP